MSEYIRVFVTTQAPTALPQDAVQHSWAFIIGGDTDRAAGTAIIQTALHDFYAALLAYLSSGYAWNTAAVEYIDMKDPRPRIPYSTQALASGAAGTGNSDYPTEVAMCLSFQGGSISGANMRRKRGRVYIGPLQVVTGDRTRDLEVGATVATAANDHLKTLDDDVEWSVYSRYTHFGVPVGENIDAKDGSGNRLYTEQSGLLAESFTPVTKHWCDNAWDTQRRRGLTATARTQFGT